jgi:alpha-galactosidase
MSIRRVSQSWVLETAKTAYAFGINEAGLLVHSYWGNKLPQIEDYPAPPSPNDWASFNRAAQLTPEEFTGYEDMKFNEPAIKLSYADGVRDVRLRYQSDSIEGETLAIVLEDSAYQLKATLYYRVHAAYDLIERWVVVENGGEAALELERIFSAQWHLPAGQNYRLHHLWGKWFDEWNHVVEPLATGVKVLESRRITSSHQHNPYFAVDKGNADESQGEVWFGLLEWSGNWKLCAEVNEFYQTRLSMGLNDWDFRWRLNAGESFQTPSAFAGYSDAGHGAASRLLHDYIREQQVPHPEQERYVLYNSWEATFFDINVEQQKSFAHKAAAMGIELFVMDDGWFDGRKNDHAGLGDWYPDSEKFPDGLSPLIEHVHGLGMKFGLWIEPEMVNPNSALYRAHPDWAIHFPNRSRTEARNQLILNLAVPEVQDYLIKLLDDLLSKNAIDFIKWDMNRNVSEPGFIQALGEQREIWVRYVRGVYRLWETLRERHPSIIWQTCSGGGGRSDLGMFHLADQAWISDNTIPARRIPMQFAYSRAYPASTMEAWVTEMGDNFVPLSFRFHVSMMGVLGVGANLAHWNDAEMQEAAKWIALYKAIRPVVQFGDMYRLLNPEPYYAVQYLSKDKSQVVVFAFRTHAAEPAAPFVFRLQGLAPEKRYKLHGRGEVKSGAAWMAVQETMMLGNFRSEILRWEVVD